MDEKRPGIIGGQGPYATYLFLEKLLQYAEDGIEKDHLHYFLDNNPKLPDRVDAIYGTGASPVPGFVKMAKNLQACGADFIVMPSNTSHAFYQDIAAQVQIPFINMIDIVADAVISDSGTGAIVGVLGTTGCIKANLYQQALEKRRSTCVVPDETELRRLMGVIHDLKSGKDAASVVRAAKEVTTSLINKGATVLVAACTELPMVLRSEDASVDLIDSLAVLAKYTVDFAKGRKDLPR